MKIQTALIQNNYKVDLFSFVSEGETFTVIAKQAQKQIWSAQVGVYLKAGKGAAQRLTTYDAERTVEDLIDFVKTEILEEGVC